MRVCCITVKQGWDLNGRGFHILVAQQVELETASCTGAAHSRCSGAFRTIRSSVKQKAMYREGASRKVWPPVTSRKPVLAGGRTAHSGRERGLCEIVPLRARLGLLPRRAVAAAPLPHHDDFGQDRLLGPVVVPLLRSKPVLLFSAFPCLFLVPTRAGILFS